MYTMTPIARPTGTTKMATGALRAFGIRPASRALMPTSRMATTPATTIGMVVNAHQVSGGAPAYGWASP